MNKGELIRSAAIFLCVSIICLITAGWIIVPPFLRKSVPCSKDSKENDCAILHTPLLIGGSIAISLVLALLLYGVATRIEHYKALGFVPRTYSSLPFVEHPGSH